ncbi:MAG: guanylate kinase [Proteobacteria bacterium]|nr:guanylate kinase [Pseudomonadota bacterium]
MQIKHLPFLIVISSPSGAGKSTLCKMIVDEDPTIKMSISVTTRPKRPGEIEGKDYYFVTQEEYSDMLKKNLFLESAHVLGNNYGTPRDKVMQELNSGNDVLFDIDGQGKGQLVNNFKGNIITIFILPPSIEELYRRLKKRAQDSDEVIAKRMERAKNEILYCDRGTDRYEYVLINEDLERTANKIRSVIDAFRIKRQDQTKIRSFMSKLASNDKWNS